MTDGRNYAVEGNDVSGYLGVDPEYCTYANSTERPHLTDLERWNFTDQLDHLEGNLDESGNSEEATEEVETEATEEVETEATEEVETSETPLVEDKQNPAVVLTPTL